MSGRWPTGLLAPRQPAPALLAEKAVMTYLPAAWYSTLAHNRWTAGLTLAAQSGATLKELMTLAGHSSARAALIYQHAAAERAAVIAAAMSDRLAPPPGQA
jgi:hypothetical protein